MHVQNFRKIREQTLFKGTKIYCTELFVYFSVEKEKTVTFISSRRLIP